MAISNNTVEHKGFIGQYSFSIDDNVYHGKIIGIDDLVTFEADSMEMVEPAFIEQVDDYILFCAEVRGCGDDGK